MRSACKFIYNFHMNSYTQTHTLMKSYPSAALIRFVCECILFSVGYWNWNSIRLSTAYTRTMTDGRTSPRISVIQTFVRNCFWCPSVRPSEEKIARPSKHRNSDYLADILFICCSSPFAISVRIASACMLYSDECYANSSNWLKTEYITHAKKKLSGTKI